MQKISATPKQKRKTPVRATAEEHAAKVKEFWLHDINPITGFEVQKESRSYGKYFAEESYSGGIVNGNRV